MNRLANTTQTDIERREAMLDRIERMTELPMMVLAFLMVPLLAGAVELLGDAQDDAFDTAIIISGDGDLASPVRAVGDRYPEKRAIVAFPPGRHSAGLRSAAAGHFTIGRDVCRDSQFPDRVAKADGYVLKRPHGWH